MLDFLIAIMVLRLHRRISWFLGKMMNSFCKLLSHSPEEHKGMSLCVSASHQWGKTNNWGTWVRGTWACALLFSQLCCSFEFFKIKKLGGIKAILKFQTTCLNSKHPDNRQEKHPGAQQEQDSRFYLLLCTISNLLLESGEVNFFQIHVQHESQNVDIPGDNR